MYKRNEIIIIVLAAACSPLWTTFTANAQEQPNGGREGKATYQELYRPQFHLTPPTGGLIDPTDLIYVNGSYQANKRLAVSPDLIHWQLNKRARLSNGIASEMSGSTVLDEHNTSKFGINGKPPLVAVYSALRKSDRRQYQCIAFSNDEGRTWTTYDRNPVLDIGSTEFRDPQVFWHRESQKWVMAVALAADRKISFYGSYNLKEWTHLSDFGQVGAKNGVWECPDIFSLPVDGRTDRQKWVLTVSVQPLGGQYFVGEFDGNTFRADDHYLKSLSQMQVKDSGATGELLFGFEKGMKGWKMTGDAFNRSAAGGSLAGQNPVFGFKGDHLVNSFHPGDQGTGTLTSPEFRITDRYLNFLVGGGELPKELQVNLKIGGRVVRSATGTNAEVLSWTGWDVGPYRNKNAVVEIIDASTGGFGHIMADHFMFAPVPAVSEWEKAFWVDYGPDFYAVRSWVNGPDHDNRRIWVGWMGSWLYASTVPSSPWRGGHTFPRTVELKQQPNGLRLVQNPIEEISGLRETPVLLKPFPVTGTSPVSQLAAFGNTYEVITELDLSRTKKAGIVVAKGAGMQTTITYDKTTGRLTVDRRHSGNTGFSKAFPKVYSAPVSLQQNRLKLHLLVDKSSVEVFANDGQTVLTCLIYPNEKATGAALFSEGGTAGVITFNAWKLKSIW
jgi:fructan beta-fructosidase